MKRSLLLFLAITTVGIISSFGQFSIGFRTGFVKAWQEYGDALVPEDASIHIYGVQASLVTSYEINKLVSFGLVPGFVRRGAACEPGFLVFNNDTKLFLDYLEVPLILTLTIPVKQKFEAYGKAGYGFSWLASAYRELRFIGSDEPADRIKLDIKNPDNINRLDHGVYLGAGLAYKTGANKIILDGKLYNGMKDVDPSNTSKNRGLHLGLGYLMQL